MAADIKNNPAWMACAFCPGCGQPFGDDSRIGLDNHDGSFWGYDCYCEHCEWSGDISPDRIGDEMSDIESIRQRDRSPAVDDYAYRDRRVLLARLDEAEQLLEEAWPYVVEHDMSLNSRIRKLLDRGSDV